MTPVTRPASGIVKSGRIPSPSGSQPGGVQEQPFEPGPSKDQHRADVGADRP